MNVLTIFCKSRSSHHMFCYMLVWLIFEGIGCLCLLYCYSWHCLTDIEAASDHMLSFELLSAVHSESRISVEIIQQCLLLDQQLPSVNEEKVENFTILLYDFKPTFMLNQLTQWSCHLNQVFHRTLLVTFVHDLCSAVMISSRDVSPTAGVLLVLKLCWWDLILFDISGLDLTVLT